MASHMEMLEMENTKLKESNKKLTKHFKTTEDKISPLKVCICNILLNRLMCLIKPGVRRLKHTGFLKLFSCRCWYACVRVCVCVRPQATKNYSREMNWITG